MRILRPILPLLVLLLLLLGGWAWLRFYTLHNVAMRVPDLQGLSFAEAEEVLKKRELQAVVIDSVYTSAAAKGAVVDQDPDPGVEVKPGRKVYLVINASQPKMMNMPNLVDLSKRQALSVADILGLKVKELVYKPDPCTDCVIEQLYKGEPIAPDARIRRGEAITLVLGSGEKGERVPVPDLRGLAMTDVRMALNMASLNVGLVVECKGCNTVADSAFARVVRQSPNSGNNRITLGSSIDLWLTTDTLGLRPVPGWDSPMVSGDTVNTVDP